MLRKVLVVMTAGFLASCGSSIPPAEDYLGARYFKTGRELEVERDKNAIAFEKKYKGNYIYSIGRIRDIGRDNFSVEHVYDGWQMRSTKIGCSVRGDKINQIANISDGDGIIAAGRVDFNADGFFKTISLDDCVWAPIREDQQLSIEGARSAIRSILPDAKKKN